VGPIIHQHEPQMAARCTASSLAHANRLPLTRLRSASGHKSDSCKQRKSSTTHFIFTKDL